MCIVIVIHLMHCLLKSLCIAAFLFVIVAIILLLFALCVVISIHGALLLQSSLRVSGPRRAGAARGSILEPLAILDARSRLEPDDRQGGSNLEAWARIIVECGAARAGHMHRAACQSTTARGSGTAGDCRRRPAVCAPTRLWPQWLETGRST